MTGDYRVYEPEFDQIDLEYGKPEGHMIIGEPLERDYDVVEGNIRVPIDKFIYAINCICGKSHPVENKKVSWDKIFKKEWDRNEL